MILSVGSWPTFILLLEHVSCLGRVEGGCIVGSTVRDELNMDR